MGYDQRATRRRGPDPRSGGSFALHQRLDGLVTRARYPASHPRRKVGADDMNWLYVLGCIAIPALWGIAMYYVFGAIGRRRRRAPREDVPPIDYSI